ncbi:FAD/NAD-P-binding domain-containing protein [Pluteus cervinus]|uniref:FAD/NAD-P-binding domain-containing protein n=1 Tax=Pluteus cervinus TaxID=181527 RepID=A0ACD3ARV1_9AGAR|nr:FAD/NAD-P-binding domain-containing protein [Pluteus cervinus]
MSSHNLRVAICGGGISGLTLAVALSKHQTIAVDLYETRSRFEEIGAGVMIWSRTWRILELLGLGPQFRDRAHPQPNGSLGVGFDFRRSDQPTEGFSFCQFLTPVSKLFQCIRFHRAEFLEPLVNTLPAGVAHFGKQVASYSNVDADGPISIQFADGSSAICDVLVGCDGLKSCVRGQLFREEAHRRNDTALLDYVHPVWTGTIAYRGLIPVDEIPLNIDGSKHRTITTPMMYCGRSKHVVSYAISKGSTVNVVTFSSQPKKNGTMVAEPWVESCSQQELLDCYSQWEPEVVTLLENIKHPSRWAIHHLRPLPFFAANRIVLIGDAAHAMAPHQGAGAGQAIEVCYITTRDDAHIALRIFDDARRKDANEVLSGSYKSGVMYEFESGFGDRYDVLGPGIQSQWDWVLRTDPEDDSLRVVEEFRKATRGTGH